MESWAFSTGEGHEFSRGWQGTAAQARARAQREANEREVAVDFWTEGSPDEAQTVEPESDTTYAVKHSHGRLTEYVDTYDEACDLVRRVYGPEAEIGHDGDITEGGESTLCWRSEEDAEDDDGARSCAKIVKRHG